MQKHVYVLSQACAAFGVKHAIICPGSRSAPLVFAFDAEKKIKCYSVIDERSAAYIALGMAQQLQKPVALVCTSGTAAINFYPAIAEAYYQKIPLVVFTADRPAELLYQQDGQMINQQGLYSKNILGEWQLPSYPYGKENLKETGRIVSEALKRCNGKEKGPVHINVPLREPLYPLHKHEENIPEESFPLPLLKRDAPPSVSSGVKDKLIKNWNETEKKLILIGQHPVDNELFTALFNLSQRDDVVILGDVLSNKHQLITSARFDFILSHTDEKTLKLLNPDLIVSLGGPLVSKSLKNWLKNQKPAFHYRIQSDSHPVDTYQNVTDFINSSAAEMLLSLQSEKETKTGIAWKNLWELLDMAAVESTSSFLDEAPFSEIGATALILNKIPDAVNLHLANSSVVRYASLLGDLNPSWTMNGNRGTSGIDGCNSSALGAALVNNKLTVLISGDIGFLYDKNAFWNHLVPDNLRVIVMNNEGGGIFTLIDGPSEHKNQLEYFTTPQKGSIKNTTEDLGMEYYFCDSENSLEAQLKTFFQPKPKAAVLEIRVDMKKNASVFNRFKKIKI